MTNLPVVMTSDPNLAQAKKDLIDNFVFNSVPYLRQKNFVAGLKTEYNKCIRKANTQISTYNTVFITDIYDSNEYEGTITVIGDPDWDAREMLPTPAGSFL